MRERYALFDLDGTLVDTIGDLAGATNDLRQELGLSTASSKTIASWVGNGMRWLVRRAMTGTHEGAPEGPNVDTAVASFQRHYAAWNGRTAAPFRDVADLLAKLAQDGWRLACVTNKPEGFARDLLARLELAPFFPVVVGGDTLPVRKPDPAVIRHTMLELAAGDYPAVVFVGDSATDVASARRAGLPVIGVSWGYNHGRNIAEDCPDVVVDTVSGLKPALDQLAQPRPWSPESLAEATNGDWLAATAPQAAQGIGRIITDTRLLKPGDLFLCLRGDRFDGHHFVDEAAAKGAAALVVDEAPAAPTLPTLVVKDSLRAYGDLGRAARKSLRGPLIAITGSSGKTSARSFTGAVLRQTFQQVLETVGNTNNLVGLPQNLMRLSNEHEAAVLEIGTNAHGEIARLSEICQPQIGIVTSIGPVHLEGLGSIAGVAEEKSCLLKALPADGIAIIPCELRKYAVVRERQPQNTFTVGTEADADFRIVWHGNTLKGSHFSLVHQNQSCEIRSSVSGRHQASNAALAVAAGVAVGIDFELASAAIASASLPGMRMRITERDGRIWINDAYNANPDSMIALIDWLATIPEWQAAASPLLILGDMFELGPEALAHHERILNEAVTKLPNSKVIAVGEQMHAVAQAPVEAFANLEDLKAQLADKLPVDGLVAIKGSRGMGLESLLPA